MRMHLAITILHEVDRTERCVISLAYGIYKNELIYKAETYSTHIENKLLITKENGGGRRIK